MANQQGKKTQPGTPSGIETGAASTGPQTSATIPAEGQDRPQNASMNTASTPNKTANAGQPVNNMGTGGTTTSTGNEPISEKISSTANGILDKAKETASGTYDAVANKATGTLEERKGELSTGLKTLADTFRKTGDDLKGAQASTPLTDLTARYTGTAASQIEKVANYFERKDIRSMMRDAEGFARRNPAIFLGAAFALGMAAARFLKSSTPNDSLSSERSLNTNLPTALPPSTERTTTPRLTNP
jgi:hypothetical protein